MALIFPILEIWRKLIILWLIIQKCSLSYVLQASGWVICNRES